MKAAITKAKDFFIEQLKFKDNSKEQDKSPTNPSSPTSNPSSLGKTNEKSDSSHISSSDSMEIQFEQTFFMKSVHIYSHLDADGLSAASILVKSLEREKIGFQITILRQLELEYIMEIQKEVKQYNRFIIFSDFGTGQIDFLNKYLNITDFLILDHHSPLNPNIPPSINHVNPYFFGIDGSFEISGAGVCYYFSLALNPNNINLAAIPLVGAIGDLQNKGEKGTFLGVNSTILNDAIKIGKIELGTDLAIARTKSLVQSICFTLPESIPGFSGNEEQVRRFLELNNIKTINDFNEPRTLADLSQLEKRTLNTAIVHLALKVKGMSTDFVKKLVTTIYTLKDYDPNLSISDLREMSSLLNACGRRNRPSLGIAVLLGDQSATQEALEEGKSYKKDIATSVDWAENHLVEHDYIISVYGGETIDEKVIGTVASMIMRSDKQHLMKPIIAYAESDGGTYKVSSRATEQMIKDGLDLSVIMREVCLKMGIENPAGGHPPAAGAKIPVTKLKEFLSSVNEAVKKQFEKDKK